ncbi:hypothetical protein BDZ91DRAFT_717168 [Kalaharituber pfeilii]|nr:hypothetical protein BDZ91DRAFT_717168 [Kalaharituber pfeilii]
MGFLTKTTAALMWGVLLMAGVGVEAACSSNLLVDDFAAFSQNLNSLGEWTSDDGTMTSISASSGKLTFTPKSDSYFYSPLSCIQASTEGYSAITFPFKAPAGGTFSLEIQTSSGGCGATAYQSHYVAVSGFSSGQTQTVTIPLTNFTGANLAAVKALVWGGFQGGSASSAWELGKVEFMCTNGGASTPMPTTTSSGPVTTANCSSPLVIDDWISQSRLTFLFYNAMMEPSSDDGTMQSIVVDSTKQRVTFMPKAGSYFYSSMNCIASSSRGYGGISMRMKATAGTTMTVELQSSAACDPINFQSFSRTSAQLGWTFDGTEKLYSIPLSSFNGLDKDHVMAVLFTMSGPVTMGPMAFYCGNTVSEYVPPPRTEEPSPTATVPITSATPTAFVIDQFSNPNSNALGFYHGTDDGMSATYSNGQLTLVSSDSDYAFYTQVSSSCRDMRAYENAYLHIAYSGSSKFTIAMQQHNSACNQAVAPYPETWDVVEASRYAVSSTDIYVPLAHFSINKQRVIGFTLKAFQTTNPTVLSKIEIVKTAPSSIKVPSKVPTAPLYFACTRPNSFAFAIDDGIPDLAQQVMQIVKEEGIKVTFFTVGAPLLDPGTNLSSVYAEMHAQGHQIALHSFTHPKLESLPSTADLDWEFKQDIEAVQQALGLTSSYFRPPFGNEGARMRQRLAALIPDAKIINWSVDVEDWLWALSGTPEKQLDAFKRDVNKGGNLVVMHYLYPSTVGYLREFIKIAKATGKQLMRVDQCMEDPSAPAL